jgi:poly(3-hydroxybutyrate) depolymerase
VIEHLPWYKGDAIAAANRLVLAARSAPDDVRGATTRMLADLVNHRLEGNPRRAPDDAWQRIHAALIEFEELEQATGGKGPGPVRASGFVRVGYVDDVDGSTQFCRAYLPPRYEASTRWPLVVYLHGYNPANPPYFQTWRVDQRHHRVADRHNVIYVEVHGRGNSQYLSLGEQDVLRCIAEVKQRLSVDEERVYLTGESMGGSGTWIVGSRHPHLFAAVAPIFGGWDQRLLPGAYAPHATLLSERFVQEAQSSFAGAEGLLNVPVFISHGDADAAVTVEYSRHATRMLQRWGYNVRYEEHPGRGHEDLDINDRVTRWLVTHRRVAAPRKVRIRSMDLGGAAAHWLQVQSFERPLDVMRVDAEVIEPGLIRLDTFNVASVVLTLPAELRGSAEALRVVWNGDERSASLAGNGQAVLRAAEPPEGGLEKNPALEGGLSRLFATPFAIVVGTASTDPAMRRLCRQKADALADLWQRWQHTLPRIINDTRVTPEDEQRYSLLLIGGPDDNLVARRMAPKLPLSVSPDGITIDGRTFAARDSVVQMIYPSPANPERYVLAVAGTSAAGMYFWNPAAFWHQRLGYPTLPMDWTIRDGRRAGVENGFGAERAWVASGVFDAAWRRDDRWVVVGDADLREQSSLREPPPPGFSVRSSVLETYEGRYDFSPGVGVTVTRRGRGLSIAFPDGGTHTLTAETEADFTLVTGGILVTFQRDASGRPTSLTINNDGQVTPAKRVTPPDPAPRATALSEPEI